MHHFSIIAVLLVAIGSQHPIAKSNGRLATIDEALQKHNIQLTPHALIDALKNSDPEVRYLAAQKLAENKTVEAISAMVEALASEKMPVTRMNIAYALAQLGEPKGFSALEETGCGNPELGGGVRAQSTEYLLNLHRESTVCLNALLDILESGTNGYKDQAASILPKFHNVSTEDLQRVFIALVKALNVSHPSVRIAASHALADMGNTAAIPELQKALASEPDEAVRFHIENDLKTLRLSMQP